MLDELIACFGALLIIGVIWEVFRDLFHPANGGALSDWVGRNLFRLLRRIRMQPAAGPLTLVSVIASWVLLLGLGFALIYNLGYPEHFRTSSGAVPPSSPGFVSALYFSFETLVTLGYGDIVPNSTTMRLIAASEALIGFGLLTASLSSIVLLYPALSRVRLLARGVFHLVEAERRTGVAITGGASDGLLAGLARDVTNARIDLVHFPITYYFATGEPQASSAYSLPQLARVAREGLSPDAPPQTQLAAGALDSALTDLARLLAERFLNMESTDRDAVFRALARDHAIDHATEGLRGDQVSDPRT